MWHIGLSEKNIKSGFESTGVFPTNPLKSPKNRLHPKMLERYNQLHPTVEEPTPTTSSENHSDDASADGSHQYLPGTSSSPDEEDAQVASEQNIDILATPSTSLVLDGWQLQSLVLDVLLSLCVIDLLTSCS